MHTPTFLRSSLVKDPFCLGDFLGPEDVLRIENEFPILFRTRSTPNPTASNKNDSFMKVSYSKPASGSPYKAPVVPKCYNIQKQELNSKKHLQKVAPNVPSKRVSFGKLCSKGQSSAKSSISDSKIHKPEKDRETSERKAIINQYKNSEHYSRNFQASTLPKFQKESLVSIKQTVTSALRIKLHNRTESFDQLKTPRKLDNHKTASKNKASTCLSLFPKKSRPVSAPGFIHPVFPCHKKLKKASHQVPPPNNTNKIVQKRVDVNEQTPLVKKDSLCSENDIEKNHRDSFSESFLSTDEASADEQRLLQCLNKNEQLVIMQNLAAEYQKKGKFNPIVEESKESCNIVPLVNPNEMPLMITKEDQTILTQLARELIHAELQSYLNQQNKTDYENGQEILTLRSNTGVQTENLKKNRISSEKGIHKLNAAETLDRGVGSFRINSTDEPLISSPNTSTEDLPSKQIQQAVLRETVSNPSSTSRCSKTKYTGNSKSVLTEKHSTIQHSKVKSDQVSLSNADEDGNENDTEDDYSSNFEDEVESFHLNQLTKTFEQSEVAQEEMKTENVSETHKLTCSDIDEAGDARIAEKEVCVVDPSEVSSINDQSNKNSSNSSTSHSFWVQKNELEIGSLSNSSSNDKKKLSDVPVFPHCSRQVVIEETSVAGLRLVDYSSKDSQSMPKLPTSIIEKANPSNSANENEAINSTLVQDAVLSDEKKHSSPPSMLDDDNNIQTRVDGGGSIENIEKNMDSVSLTESETQSLACTNPISQGELIKYEKSVGELSVDPSIKGSLGALELLCFKNRSPKSSGSNSISSTTLDCKLSEEEQSSIFSTAL